MRVPLSWLRRLRRRRPDARAARRAPDRCSAWRSRPSSAGAPTGRTSSSASCSRSRKHPQRRPAVADDASASATASRSSIVCGATNIAPGQRVPVALPGAVLPGDRRIERTEKMGVVSNGMLCSGDELGLTSDADGILILPAGHADRERAHRAVRRHGPRRRRQAEPRRRAVPRRPRPRGLGDDRRAACASRTIELVERGVADRRPASRSRSASRSCAPGSSAGSSAAFTRRSVAGPGPDAPPGGRDAPGEQRRRREQLRDARARQADPHVRRWRPSTSGAIVVRRAAPGERLVTLDHVERVLDPETLLIADPVEALGIAGVMGGATSEVERHDDRDRHRVGRLRPGLDPPDRPALRPALRGEPPLREGPGGPPRPHRRRPRRPARRRLGRRRGRPGPGRHRTGRARTRSRRVPPGPA